MKSVTPVDELRVNYEKGSGFSLRRECFEQEAACFLAWFACNLARECRELFIRSRLVRERFERKGLGLESAIVTRVVCASSDDGLRATQPAVAAIP